jgi:hypothetical protein
MTRSTNPFCHGDRGAVRTAWMFHVSGRRRDRGKDGIAIMEEVSGRFVVRKPVAQLLGRPSRGRMVGDRHVNEPPTVVRKNDEHEEQPEGDRRHDEQIGGHDLARVIGQECSPRL